MLSSFFGEDRGTIRNLASLTAGGKETGPTLLRARNGRKKATYPGPMQAGCRQRAAFAVQE
jgi:hypothetical protein